MKVLAVEYAHSILQQGAMTLTVEYDTDERDGSMQNVILLDTENVVSKRDRSRVLYEVAVIIGNIEGIVWEGCFSFPIPTPYSEYEYVPNRRINVVGYTPNAHSVRKVEDTILNKVLEFEVYKGYAYNASFDYEALVGASMDYLANGIEWYDLLQAVRVRWSVEKRNLFRDLQSTWSRNGLKKSSNLGDVVDRLSKVREVEARPDHSALADTRALFGLWQDFKTCHKRTDFSIE